MTPMLGEQVERALLEWGSARIAGVLTPTVGEAAARFHAERIASALLSGEGDAITVASAILPLPPEQRHQAAAQVATVWSELSPRS